MSIGFWTRLVERAAALALVVPLALSPLVFLAWACMHFFGWWGLFIMLLPLALVWAVNVLVEWAS